MKTSKCINCGNKFDKKYRTEKLCSDECRRINNCKNMKIYRNTKKGIKTCEEYRIKNVEKKSTYDKEYLKDPNNLEKRHKYNMNWEKHKYHNDINYKLKYCLRRRISPMIKNNKFSKSSLELIGCDLCKLKNRLEKLFKNGMSWDNYGSVWEIDHIKPVSKFNMMNYKEQLECFNYKNLQPLFVTENRRKHATYEG